MVLIITITRYDFYFWPCNFILAKHVDHQFLPAHVIQIIIKVLFNVELAVFVTYKCFYTSLLVKNTVIDIVAEIKVLTR